MFKITVKKTTKKTFVYIEIDNKSHFLISGKKDMFSYSSNYQNLHFAISAFLLENKKDEIDNVQTLANALSFVRINFFDKFMKPQFKINFI